MLTEYNSNRSLVKHVLINLKFVIYYSQGGLHKRPVTTYRTVNQ